MNERWGEIMRFIPEKQKDLEKLKELLDNFHVCFQDVERLVVEAITLCAFYMPAMNVERLQESLAAITTMQLSFGDKENDIDMIQVLGIQIMDLLEKESTDIAAIQGQVSVPLRNRYHHPSSFVFTRVSCHTCPGYASIAVDLT